MKKEENNKIETFENGDINEYDENGNLIKCTTVVDYGYSTTLSVKELNADGYIISFKQPYKNSRYEYDENYRYEHKLDYYDNIKETIKTIKTKKPNYNNKTKKWNNNINQKTK